MRRLARALGVLGILLLPSAVFAQTASIVGVVKDSSGGVLPGVTVEAASPVLIEKVRTTVSDGNGRFQIVDLRPGAYTVSFTLSGFNTYRREGVALAGSQTVQVDGEMRVGALEESITVTGEAPVVDVQTTARQSVLSAETIDSLPIARNYVALARLIPGTTGGGNDVGGSELQDVGGSVTVHGSKSTDQRVTLNGINTMTLQAGGNIGGQIPDLGSAAEVTVDTSSLGADLPTGGVRINFVPRDGGNRFNSSTFFTFANQSMQGDNFTDTLLAQGLAAPNKIDYNYDLNESIGGPFKKDKVWFWFSARYNQVSNYAAILENANAFKPNEWLYVPVPGAQAKAEGFSQNSSIRVTWQASPKHKIAGTYKADHWCNCPDGISASTSPEAGYDRRFPRLRQEHLEWTSPLTSRVLMEAVGLHLFERWGNMHLRVKGGSLDTEEQEAAMRQMISVNDQGLGLTYRSAATHNNTHVPNFSYRFGTSYITGSHAFKVGFNRTHGFLRAESYALNPISYRFNNGVPNQVTIRALPQIRKTELDNDIGVFVQDRWNLDRWTVSGALRYDMFQTSWARQTLGPTQYTPNRNTVFEPGDILDWKDITYRSGVTYDVFGNGKTAFKASFNKYLLGQTLNGIASSPNPIQTITDSASRTWNDTNGNFNPDCDLLNFAANGECLAVSNASAFGTSTITSTFDPDLLTGWGHRPANWEISASVQHELLPRVSVDVGYFRRIWKNFQVTDNLAFDASSYDIFNVTVPNDSRLPNAGATLVGLKNLKPALNGVQNRNYNTLDSKFGGQIEHWDGVDVTVNARTRNGITLQFGTSTGRTLTDDCAVRAALPESGLLTPASRCHIENPFQTTVKGYATWVVPVVDVQVSGTFRSAPGGDISASLAYTPALLTQYSTLGRAPTGGGNLTVSLLEPNTLFGDRNNQLDLRFGKVLRYRGLRSVVSVDMFNALNTNVVTGRSNTFNLAPSTAYWPRPTSILNARLFKVSMNVDF